MLSVTCEPYMLSVVVLNVVMLSVVAPAATIVLKTVYCSKNSFLLTLLPFSYNGLKLVP
jgi:hypothetical protein